MVQPNPLNVSWSGTYPQMERQEKEVQDDHRYEALRRVRTDNARLQEERALVKKAAASLAQQLP